MWSFSHLASGCFFPKKRFDRGEFCEPCSLIRWKRGQQACGWSYSHTPCALLCEALRLLHGDACDQEWDNIKEERNNAAGVQAKRPWELFTDRTVRWQLLTIILLNTAQQLNGINAVRTPSPSRPADRRWRPLVSSIVRETFFLTFLSWNIFTADLLLHKLLVPASGHSQWQNTLRDHWHRCLWMPHGSNMREYLMVQNRQEIKYSSRVTNIRNGKKWMWNI